ncbi:MAG: DUF1566 domain-containing protein [Gammaproteobacteria bacterium]|nr:DUF1566 domain-containing protein [Gammaproteobacteria bacterium]
MALLLLAPTAYSEDAVDDNSLHSGEGMINRAPFVSSKIDPSNLDRISTDISEITDSLSNILTDPIEEEAVTEVLDEKPAQTLTAEPVIAIPETIEVAKPVIVETKPVAVIEEIADTPLATQLKSTVVAEEKQPEIITQDTTSEADNELKIKYLKKGSDGNILPDNASSWACVEDVKNGLIWEIKANDGSTQDKNNSFTWYQPEASETLYGIADGGRCTGDSDCDTHAYIKYINQKNYCGYSNWRLPTKEEMLGIVEFKNNTSTAKIDTEYFPDALPSWYWTASSNENHPEHAWYVLFRNGIAINDLKERPKHIRLVRSQTEKG